MKSFLFALFFSATAILSVNAGNCPNGGGCGGGKDKPADKPKEPTSQGVILVP